MQGKCLFEYAILRIVPKVEREEFLNVGVVLYCKEHRFLEMRYSLDEEKLIAFCKSLDIEEIREYLEAFRLICEGSKETEMGKLPPAERFRWLTATRSTVVQTSKVHPGFCSNPSEMLLQLYNTMVL
jgi:hypothetical protein